MTSLFYFPKRLIVCFFIFSFATPIFSQTNLWKIEGTILCETTLKTFPGVKIQIAGSTQTTESDDDGHFTLVFESNTANPVLRIEKEGIPIVERQLSLPLEMPLDIRIDCSVPPPAAPLVEINSVTFGREITGSINGITSEMVGKYKMLIYVYTNQYWIHPFEMSYTIIEHNGEWKITSHWPSDSPCPSRVLAVIVDKDYVVKSPTPIPPHQVMSSHEVSIFDQSRCIYKKK